MMLMLTVTKVHGSSVGLSEIISLDIAPETSHTRSTSLAGRPHPSSRASKISKLLTTIRRSANHVIYREYAASTPYPHDGTMYDSAVPCDHSLSSQIAFEHRPLWLGCTWEIDKCNYECPQDRNTARHELRQTTRTVSA